jgi:hypothetical protein
MAWKPAWAPATRRADARSFMSVMCVFDIRYGGTCKSKIFISGTEYMSLCIELFFVKYKVHVFSVIFDFLRTRYKYIVPAKKTWF